MRWVRDISSTAGASGRAESGDTARWALRQNVQADPVLRVRRIIRLATDHRAPGYRRPARQLLSAPYHAALAIAAARGSVGALLIW